jgi:hypothetical protein
MAYLNHPLPAWTCYIRNEFLFNHTKGFGEFTLCDVHSVASIENRVPLFEAFLENGVNWTRRPLHAFCWNKDAEPSKISDVYYWNCFSPYIDVQRRPRLAGLRADLITISGAKLSGNYMFTLDWSWENRSIINTNFSETPEHKCAHMFRMDTGNFYAYPNNRIIWEDLSFTGNRITKNPGYIIDQTKYQVENLKRGETDDKYIYEIKEGIK